MSKEKIMELYNILDKDRKAREAEAKILELIEKQRKAAMNKALIRTVLGLVIFVAGIAITSAARGEAIFYGAILVGFFMFVKGLTEINVLSKPRN